MPFSVAVARGAQGARRARILAGVCVASGVFALVPPLFARFPLSVSIALTTLYLCLVFADAGTLPAAVLDETPPSRRGVASVGAMLNLAGGPSSKSAWLVAFATVGAGSAIGGAALWLTERWHRPPASEPH